MSKKKWQALVERNADWLADWMKTATANFNQLYPKGLVTEKILRIQCQIDEFCEYCEYETLWFIVPYNANLIVGLNDLFTPYDFFGDTLVISSICHDFCTKSRKIKIQNGKRKCGRYEFQQKEFLYFFNFLKSL